MRPPWWLPFGRTPQLEAEELADALRSDDPPHVLDVRSRAEYRWGHVPRARSLPLRTVPRHLRTDALDRHRPVVAVSLGGHRAAPLVRLLQDRGYDAYRLARGMRSWWAADFPTVGGDSGDPERITGSPLPRGDVLDTDDASAYRRALEALTGVHATTGNRIDVLRNGVEIFPPMLDAVRTATSSVDLLSFVYWTGAVAREFADALAERARAGVRVRVLLDAYGAREMDRQLVVQMRSAGARVEWFRPVLRDPLRANHRTHRKVLVCDGTVAFTGGVGIAEEWQGDARDPSEWRDTHFRVEGPAVAGLRAGFLGNWIETGGALAEDGEQFPPLAEAGDACIQLIRSQAAAAGLTDAEVALRALLRVARRRIRITTAYFEPDKPFVRLLRDALDRGVQVQILVPGPHIDKRVVRLAQHDEVEALLDAGTSVWRYMPTMLHAKVMTVDGVVACVGSVNINTRSLEKDDELSLVVHDRSTVEVLDRHFDEDLRRAEPIDLAGWRDAGPVRRAGRAMANLLDPEM